MNISDLLQPDAVLASLKVQNKKQLLQELAARAAQQTGLPERKIFETLTERERLGSTGVGQGIAVPHGRMADIQKIAGVFARLETPIDRWASWGIAPSDIATRPSLPKTSIEPRSR